MSGDVFLPELFAEYLYLTEQVDICVFVFFVDRLYLEFADFVGVVWGDSVFAGGGDFDGFPLVLRLQI